MTIQDAVEELRTMRASHIFREGWRCGAGVKHVGIGDNGDDLIEYDFGLLARPPKSYTPSQQDLCADDWNSQKEDAPEDVCRFACECWVHGDGRSLTCEMRGRSVTISASGVGEDGKPFAFTETDAVGKLHTPDVVAIRELAYELCERFPLWRDEYFQHGRTLWRRPR